MLLEHLSSQVHPRLGRKKCQRARGGMACTGRVAPWRMALSRMQGDTRGDPADLYVSTHHRVRRRYSQASPYVRCFCLRMRHPAPPRIATPHSCAQPCSRPRLGCKHACPLPCHPGPCPSCAVTIQVKCFCGRERHSAKCQVGVTAASFSCGQPCRKPLSCGKSDHLCVEMCHEGTCSPCREREQAWCWCGRETKYIGCGEVTVAELTKCVFVEDDGSQREWTGSYGCDHLCGRYDFVSRCIKVRTSLTRCSLARLPVRTIRVQNPVTHLLV